VSSTNVVVTLQSAVTNAHGAFDPHGNEWMPNGVDYGCVDIGVLGAGRVGSPVLAGCW